MLFLLAPFFLAASSAQIEINGETLLVEIAESPEERSCGLMERDHLTDGAGMLFVFEEPQMLAFWMKNTRIPLSIAFFDSEKKLINTIDMDPAPKELASPPLHYSERPSCYALEVPKGWFAKHRIRRGMKFSFHDQQDRVK